MAKFDVNAESCRHLEEGWCVTCLQRRDKERKKVITAKKRKLAKIRKRAGLARSTLMIEKIDPELKEDFKKACRENGKFMWQVATELMEAYVEENR